jgi:hypothetical protein
MRGNSQAVCGRGHPICCMSEEFALGSYLINIGLEKVTYCIIIYDMHDSWVISGAIPPLMVQVR